MFVQPQELSHESLDPVPFHGAFYLPAHNDAEPRNGLVIGSSEQEEMG